MSGQRTTGTVLWFNDQKGYGFISPDSGGDEVFVHSSAVETEDFPRLDVGDRVEFLIEKTSRGLKASNVYKI